MKIFICTSCQTTIGGPDNGTAYCCKCGMPMFYDKFRSEKLPKEKVPRKIKKPNKRKKKR